jgi:hypothetical protein
MGGWGGMATDKNLVAKWREDIVGDWLEELEGTDPLNLQPVTSRTPKAMSLLADGTAVLRAETDVDIAPSFPEAPFLETWELSEDRVLSLWVPIAPMPEYDLPDWSRDSLRYDVLDVTDLSLTLCDRRFDGETVKVWRRINREDYNRRKAEEYGQISDFLK